MLYRVVNDFLYDPVNMDRFFRIERGNIRVLKFDLQVRIEIIVDDRFFNGRYQSFPEKRCGHKIIGDLPHSKNHLVDMIVYFFQLCLVLGRCNVKAIHF